MKRRNKRESYPTAKLSIKSAFLPSQIATGMKTLRARLSGDRQEWRKKRKVMSESSVDKGPWITTQRAGWSGVREGGGREG